MKKYLNVVTLSIFIVSVAVIGNLTITENVFGYAPRSNTIHKDYSFKRYLRSSDIRPITSGTVNMGHIVNMTRGGYEMCSNSEVLSFSYSNSLTFNATNGAWDTPYGRWCSSVNNLCTSIWNGQKVYDQSDINWWMGKCGAGCNRTDWWNAGLRENRIKEARIMWTAVKPGAYLISSNPNVVRCSGMNCWTVSDGRATVTAYAQKTQARIWAYVEFRAGWGWISETMPYLNNHRTNKMWVTSRNVWIGNWTINVGRAARCNYCGDKKIKNEQCDTTAGSSPVNNCTAAYNSSCRYCVSPGRTGQCTWITKPGPKCGDGIRHSRNGEQCDNGVNNGVACIASHGETCNYCSNTCKNAVATGPYCGDNRVNGVTEECDGTSGVPENASCNAQCKIVYEAICGTADDIETGISPTENLCPATLHTTSEVTLVGGNWEWTCDHTGAIADPRSVPCSAPLPKTTCGTQYPDKISNTTPPSGSYTLCGTGSTNQATPTLETSGKWHWVCEHSQTAQPPLADCEAPTCLSGDPIEFQRYVTFESAGHPQNASVTVSCPGSKVCCKIKKTRAPSDMIICSDTVDGYIEVRPGSHTYPTECWFDKDDNGEDNGELKVNVTDITVSTMCTARECNAQGTCQGVPQEAEAPNQCKSSCSSNADCSSGRMIETRP